MSRLVRQATRVLAENQLEPTQDVYDILNTGARKKGETPAIQTVGRGFDHPTTLIAEAKKEEKSTFANLPTKQPQKPRFSSETAAFSLMAKLQKLISSSAKAHGEDIIAIASHHY